MKEEDVKIAFVSRYQDEADRLDEFLVNSCKIDVIRKPALFSREILLVNKNDYIKAIAYGSLFVVENNLSSISWVDSSSQEMENIADIASITKSFTSLDKLLPSDEIESAKGKR